jgi:L-serine dehydratase
MKNNQLKRKNYQIMPIDISIKNCFDKSEIDYCLKTIEDKVESGQTGKNFRYKENSEECILHDFNYEKLGKALSTHTVIGDQPSLYRIISNQADNYMIILFYSDIASNTPAKVIQPDLNNIISEISRSKKGFTFHYEYNKSQTSITILINNISKGTLINNVLETFQKNFAFPPYLELWQFDAFKKGLKSLYLIKCNFEYVLKQDLIESLENDFERYLQHFIKPMSVFDIVGPSMVGPSSSHTAGANKIGQIARNIIIARSKSEKIKVNSIEVKLLGSFRDTGPGHYTPSAIGGGLCGFPPDHAKMIQHGDPDFLYKHGIDFGDFISSFSGYKKGSPEEEIKYKNENNNNIAEIIVKTEKGEYLITGFSIGGGNVEVRYLNEPLAIPLTGKEELYYYDGKIISHSDAKQHEDAVLIQVITGKSNSNDDYKMPFNTFEELINYISHNKRKMIDVIFEVESNLQGTGKDEINSKAAGYWKIMKSSIKKGIKSKELSLFNLTGKDARRINKYAKKNPLFNNIYGKATAYAVAVNEVNAKCGVIVACPTAGSCGILPGVIKAYSDIVKPKPKKIFESLLVAGFLGMILFDDVTTAGADYGCQAEVGAAAAMAAAALTYLENGSHEEIIQAFTLVLKNSLGLICDPVAGLVEIPCVKRNGIFVSVAISAALMALSGVESFISPDEVILTMKEVGEKLHHDYKETAGGGLAKTRDGKAVDKAFASEVNRFFGEN